MRRLTFGLPIRMFLHFARPFSRIAGPNVGKLHSALVGVVIAGVSRPRLQIRGATCSLHRSRLPFPLEIADFRSFASSLISLHPLAVFKSAIALAVQLNGLTLVDDDVAAFAHHFKCIGGQDQGSQYEQKQIWLLHKHLFPS